MSTPPPSPPPPSRRQRLVLLGALLVVAAATALTVDLSRQAHAVEAIGWNKPQALSSPSDRPTLLRFSADWCPPCQSMKRNVLSRPEIAQAVQDGFRPVSVDLTQPDDAAQALALRHRVDSIPAFVLLDARGNETARLVGGATPQAFMAFLQRHSAAGLSQLD